MDAVYVVQKHYHLEGSDVVGVYADKDEAVRWAKAERAENDVPDSFTVTNFPLDGACGVEVFNSEWV